MLVQGFVMFAHANLFDFEASTADHQLSFFLPYFPPLFGQEALGTYPWRFHSLLAH
jgi:hypothetical protein